MSLAKASMKIVSFLKKIIIVFVIFEAEQMDLSEPPLSSIMKHALCLQIQRDSP